MAKHIRMITWSAGAGKVLEGNLDELLPERGELHWIDIQHATEADLDKLSEAYGGAKTNWAEVGRKALVPKAQTYAGFVFTVWFVLEKFEAGKNIEPSQVFLFMGKDQLVTVHRNTIGLLDQVWDAYAADMKMMAEGPFRPFFRVISDATNAGLPVLEDLDTEIDSIEDGFLNLPSDDQLPRLSLAKHNLLDIKRIFFFESASIYMLGSDGGVFGPEDRRSLEELHQTLLYLVDMADTYRDVITGAIDLHLSAISNRLNEVMKRLTVIATVFMPLTFVAGVYGMNFAHMPELTWRWGYLLVWLLMLAIGIYMVVYIRRKKWF